MEGEGKWSPFFAAVRSLLVWLILLRIRVFGWKKGKPLAALNYHSATVNCVSFAARTAPEEHRNALICGSRDQRITLWKLY